MQVEERTGVPPTVMRRIPPTVQWGWRTGIDLAAGRLTTFDEALDQWSKSQQEEVQHTSRASGMEGEDGDEQDTPQLTEDPEDGVLVGELDLMVPEPGWGLKKRRMDPRIFAGDVGACLMFEDLVNYVRTMGFATSSGTVSRADLMNVIVEGLRGLEEDCGYHLRERGTKRAIDAVEETAHFPRKRKTTAVLKRPAGPTTEIAVDQREHGESSAVDLDLEDPYNKVAVPCAVVAAMQDIIRAQNTLRDDDLPNLCWNWLWFRRYVLGVAARCRPAMARCHYVDEDRGQPAWVTREELMNNVRDAGISGEDRVEFVEQLDWFRQLVLESDVVTLVRHPGGELGMRVVGTQRYSEVRKALPGFLSPISEGTALTLREAGYTSLYKDGTRNYVLYGPLALVQHADVSDVVLGRPMLGFDWVLSVGSKLCPAPGLKTIREIRLRGEGRGAEARLRPA
jgi:hypothetical protein